MCQKIPTQTIGSIGTITFTECPPFQAFRKIPRLNRDICITEKIDGTNAQVVVTECGKLLVGKRSGYMTPQNDNHGFARWCEEHKEELLKLPVGRHYGEWWGKGVQRGYGVEDKRFTLFNASLDRSTLPACVSVVPVLYDGPFSADAITRCLEQLRSSGSVIAPGFLKPEGIVVYHKTSGNFYKVTLENDEKPKGIVVPDEV